MSRLIYNIYLLSFCHYLSQHVEFGTYRIVKQRRLGRVCANAQTRQSLFCLHAKSIDADKDRANFRPLASLDTSALVFKGGVCACAICIKISRAGPILAIWTVLSGVTNDQTPFVDGIRFNKWTDHGTIIGCTVCINMVVIMNR